MKDLDLFPCHCRLNRWSLVSICLMVLTVPQARHCLGLLIFIKCLCVSLVLPIFNLVKIMFSFRLKFIGIGHRLTLSFWWFVVGYIIPFMVPLVVTVYVNVVVILRKYNKLWNGLFRSLGWWLRLVLLCQFFHCLLFYNDPGIIY